MALPSPAGPVLCVCVRALCVSLRLVCVIRMCVCMYLFVCREPCPEMSPQLRIAVHRQDRIRHTSHRILLHTTHHHHHMPSHHTPPPHMPSHHHTHTHRRSQPDHPTPSSLCTVLDAYLDCDAVLCEAIQCRLKWARPYPLLKGARGQTVSLPHHQLTTQEATNLLRSAMGQCR